MKPWLLLPAGIAHQLSDVFLKAYGFVHSQKTIEWKSFDWRGLHFSNPLGIAGGVDKDANNIKAWWSLGLGFVEIGTVTPLPQSPNPGKIIDRSLAQMALWNKMGFPSKGFAHVKANLEKLPGHHTPLFINIGKNRATTLEDAGDDYVKGLNFFHQNADVFVVNISSPNTQNLRQLQQIDNLKRLLEQLDSGYKKVHGKKSKPILFKLSPDLDNQELADILNLSCDFGVDGWILCNTTQKRWDKKFPIEGGVSGKPLSQLSVKHLKDAVNILGARRQDKLLVSVGGVLTHEDIEERLRIGANLVQVYSALVFEGLSFFKRSHQHFKAMTNL